jgi:hypothetical protein
VVRESASADPERADQAVGRRRHVHRACAAAVYTRCAAEHLVEEGLRVDAQRERVTVAAVGGRHPVALLEQACNAGRHRLLPRIQMRRAVDLALQEERLHKVLEAADEEHLTVDPRVALEVVEHAGTRPVHVAPISDARRSAR